MIRGYTLSLLLTEPVCTCGEEHIGWSGFCHGTTIMFIVTCRSCGATKRSPEFPLQASIFLDRPYPRKQAPTAIATSLHVEREDPEDGGAVILYLPPPGGHDPPKGA